MCWRLFLTFLKIGAFTFGGGYAMISIIEHEVINRRGWIARHDFLDLLTLAQSAPGPISLNTAVFIGYRMRGLRGALSAILGAIIPSFVIILCIAIAKKNATIREQKAEIKAFTEQVDSLNGVVGRLWGMDCITVNTVCNIQQKGLVNTTASTQISKSVAEYTRGELVMALDSITKANKGK